MKQFFFAALLVVAGTVSGQTSANKADKCPGMHDATVTAKADKCPVMHGAPTGRTPGEPTRPDRPTEDGWISRQPAHQLPQGKLESSESLATFSRPLR